VDKGRQKGKWEAEFENHGSGGLTKKVKWKRLADEVKPEGGSSRSSKKDVRILFSKV